MQNSKLKQGALSLLVGLVAGVPLTMLGTAVIGHSMDSYNESYKTVKPADAIINNDVQYGSRDALSE